jgi:hypothetical protein
MKGWMVWVELTGGTLLQRMRLYPLALKANGMTERKR